MLLLVSNTLSTGHTSSLCLLVHFNFFEPQHFVSSFTSTFSNLKAAQTSRISSKMKVIFLSLLLCWSVAYGHELEMQGVVSKVWKKLTPTRSGVPPARRDHAAVSVGDKMLVFGGFDGHRHYGLNDLWEYSMKQNTWKRLIAWGQYPPKLRKHTAVSAGDKMLVFGGDDGLRTLYRKDLWEYSMKRNKWKQLKPKGRGPSERAAHTAVSAGDKMLVFGGEKKEQNKKHLLMDLWEYSMKQNTWKQLNKTMLLRRGKRKDVTWKTIVHVWQAQLCRPGAVKSVR